MISTPSAREQVSSSKRAIATVQTVNLFNGVPPVKCPNEGTLIVIVLVLLLVERQEGSVDHSAVC